MNDKNIFIGATLFVLILSVYTTIYTDVSIAISMMFIGLDFWYASILFQEKGRDY